MGELLAPREYLFDSDTTLTWKDLRFSDSGEILIYLPHTKTKGLKGEFIDLFPFTTGPCCPVKSLLKLRDLHISNSSFDLNKPVFMFASGKFLTTAKLNQLLRDLLSDICDKNNGMISCHSFRAGIPSTLSGSAVNLLTEDIKNFGRWRGSSYKLYTRLEKDKRRLLYDRIYNVLYNVYSYRRKYYYLYVRLNLVVILSSIVCLK